MDKAKSIRAKRLWKDPDFRLKQHKARSKAWENNKRRESQSEMMCAEWEDPSTRTQRIATQKEVHTDPKYLAKLSMASKRSWKDANIRAKRIEALNTKEVITAISNASKKNWNDVAYKKRMSEKHLKEFAIEGRKPGTCNFGVFVKTKKAGKIICHGSTGAEERFANLLDSIAEVISFEKDHLRIPYKWKGKWRTYFPDYYIRLKHGLRLIVELSTVTDNKDNAKIEAAMRYCAKRKWKFLLVTDMSNLTIVKKVIRKRL